MKRTLFFLYSSSSTFHKNMLIYKKNVFWTHIYIYMKKIK